MGKRSRPRLHDRRTAAAALHAERYARGRRWAHIALIGSVSAWLITVVAAGVILSAVDTETFRWGIAWPSRRGGAPLELDVARGHVLVLAASLLVIPVCLAAVGLVQTRELTRLARQDHPRHVSFWSQAGALAAAALAPNAIGCLWVSATRPSSDLLFLPEAWPAITLLLGPLLLLLWELFAFGRLTRS